MLANHTSIATVLRRIVAGHDRFFKRNAYLDPYVREMSSIKEQLEAARETVMGVVQEYEAAERDDYLTGGAVAATNNNNDGRTDGVGR